MTRLCTKIKIAIYKLRSIASQQMEPAFCTKTLHILPLLKQVLFAVRLYASKEFAPKNMKRANNSPFLKLVRAYESELIDENIKKTNAITREELLREKEQDVSNPKLPFITTFNRTLPNIREKIYFFMHFCPGTITTHAESINSDLQIYWTYVYDTYNIEHRTEPVSH